MALKFHPRRGDLLICDFSMGGFQPPEMVKKRPVVVVSRNHGGQTCIVVPLSGTEPDQIAVWTPEITLGSIPGKWANRQLWAKCDMVCAVGFQRLDRMAVGSGRARRYEVRRANAEDLAAIEHGLRAVMLLGKND